MTTPSQRFILGLPMPSSALISISPIRLRTQCLNVPPGTQGGQTFCIRKKVSTILKRDDKEILYITVQIKVPQDLDETSKIDILKLKNKINEL